MSKAVSVLGIHHLRMHFCIGRVRSRFILNIRMESAALTDRKNPKWPVNGWKKIMKFRLFRNFVIFFLQDLVIPPRWCWLETVDVRS